MKIHGAAAVGAFALLAGSAHAATFTVDAMANSSSGGVGVSTFAVTAGETLLVDVNPNDLWNAGALPRWSNADGLTHDLFATGTDDSGQAAGTLIGQDFGLWQQGNLTAPFGALVGEINGDFEILGTHFAGTAWQTGQLTLFYWDSNNGDNTQFITANVVARSATPEPAAWALLISGFGMAGAALRRRRRTTLA
jgi:hypothetical protein